MGVESATTEKEGLIKSAHVISATRSSNLTLSPSTNVVFNQITSGYSLSGGGIVVPETGKYFVNFVTRHNFGTVTGNAYFRIRVNGSDSNPSISMYIDQVNHATTSKSYNSGAILDLQQGDVVNLFTAFAGTLNIITSTALQMHIIR